MKGNRFGDLVIIGMENKWSYNIRSYYFKLWLSINDYYT